MRVPGPEVRPPRSDKPGVEVRRLGPILCLVPATDLDQIVNLCKRRGFVYQSAEIYGGFRSTYDYGPLGSLLLRNVKDAWVRSMVQQRDDVVLHRRRDPQPAAGVAGLRPPRQLLRPARRLHELQEPAPPRQARRSRHLPELRREEQLHRGPRVQPDVQDPGRPGRGHRRRCVPATRDGPGHVHQLRDRCCRPARKKPPFGIAQVGKSFRNEITPQNWIFRTREFEQMEMEFFVPPDESEQWYEYWCKARLDWYIELGIPPDMLRCAHTTTTSCRTIRPAPSDVEFQFPWGFDELEGIAKRTDFDLKAARRGVGRDARLLRPADQRALRALRDRAGRRRDPHDGGVPAGRLRRGRGQRRDAHRAAPAPAPRAVQGRRAAAVARRTRSPRWPTRCASCSPTATWSTTTRPRTSASGTAARTRSARRSAVTVDFDSLDDNAVTVRDRDTTEQVRVPIDELLATVSGKLGF